MSVSLLSKYRLKKQSCLKSLRCTFWERCRDVKFEKILFRECIMLFIMFSFLTEVGSDRNSCPLSGLLRSVESLLSLVGSFSSLPIRACSSAWS